MYESMWRQTWNTGIIWSHLWTQDTWVQTLYEDICEHIHVSTDPHDICEHSHVNEFFLPSGGLITRDKSVQAQLVWLKAVPGAQTMTRHPAPGTYCSKRKGLSATGLLSHTAATKIKANIAESLSWIIRTVASSLSRIMVNIALFL